MLQTGRSAVRPFIIYGVHLRNCPSRFFVHSAAVASCSKWGNQQNRKCSNFPLKRTENSETKFVGTAAGTRSAANGIRLGVSTLSLNNAVSINSQFRCFGLRGSQICNQQQRRYASTEAELAKLGLKMSDLGSIPPAPSVCTDPTLLDTLHTVVSGNIFEVGLGSWWPWGVFQQCLHYTQTYTDLPWWMCIVILTVSIRLLLSPILVRVQRFAANAHNQQPRISAVMRRLQNAQRSGDKMASMEATADLMHVYKKYDCNPARQLLFVMPQGFVFFSAFFGLRQMVQRNVEGMAVGGAYWFTDLTQADSLFALEMLGFTFNVPGALPTISALTMAAVLHLGVEFGNSPQMMTKWMRRGMLYGVPTLVLLTTSQFASALCVYWATSNVMSLFFAGIFNAKPIRSFLNIPMKVQHPANFKPVTGFAEAQGRGRVNRGWEDLMREHNEQLYARSSRSTEETLHSYTLKPSARRFGRL